MTGMLRDRLLLTLVAAHIALKAVLLPRATSSPIVTDENYYNNAGKMLANAIRQIATGGGVPTQDLRDRVVGNGWFMPGMSALLTPLYLVAPHASLRATRIYIGVVSLIAFLVVVALVYRVLGRPFALALLVVPGLVPVWILYSYALFGDEMAGLTIVAVVALLVVLWRRLYVDREPPRLREGVVLGLLLVATLYLRSSALPLVGGLLVLAVVAAAVLLRGRARLKGVGVLVAAAVIFGALLAPWSWAATRTFGERTITTTTLPVSEAYAFGHHDQLCFGQCVGGGGIWLEMTRYSRVVGRATGESEITVQKQMSQYALRDVTPRSYTRDVLSDLHRYALEPGRANIVTVTGDDGVGHAISVVTDLLYFVALALGAVGLLLARRLPHDRQVLMILVGLSVAALFIQPFVHVCTPRYWPVFAPLLGLGAATLWGRSDRASTNGWLRMIHGGVAAGWIVVLAAVAGVALA